MTVLWENIILFGIALVAAWFAASAIFAVARRILRNGDDFWKNLVAQTRMPVRLAILIASVSFAANFATLPAQQGGLIRHLLLIAFIACLTLIARAALNIWMSLHLRRYRIDVDDNLMARKHVTQSRILQRVGGVLIIAIGTSAALMTIESVRQYGVSLLASAGAAGIVVGLALQPLLKNLFAGIQLALTQPIRIDDAVIVEGEWGNIEEINGTYVVIRIWDKRRLVVPLNYFIEQPFQNWTRSDSTLLGTVMIYVDYRAPVEEMRAEARRIVEASPLWDRDVFVLQVTDFRENVVEIRILASARSAPRAFDLRCEIREKLLTWLQQSGHAAMPRVRAEIAA
ncbi:mechanosensitive ion channel family protein [Paracoccus zeaxanthinifaciens]|uniref:mechanosensitive ion channel family protein n=1 Tax=Paracoccus zeaxanthinifaciens TaxID=187400 RepID=UPI000415EF15|nr:mechanosensitive ion channel domain-containing protein [Paracoccus zeaxanthinifaciens]